MKVEEKKHNSNSDGYFPSAIQLDVCLFGCLTEKCTISHTFQINKLFIRIQYNGRNTTKIHAHLTIHYLLFVDFPHAIPFYLYATHNLMLDASHQATEIFIYTHFGYIIRQRANNSDQHDSLRYSVYVEEWDKNLYGFFAWMGLAASKYFWIFVVFFCATRVMKSLNAIPSFSQFDCSCIDCYWWGE